MMEGTLVWLLFGVLKLNYLSSLLITIVVVGIIGLATERIIFSAASRINHANDYRIQLVYASDRAIDAYRIRHHRENCPCSIDGICSFGGVVFPRQRLMVMVIAIILMVA